MYCEKRCFLGQDHLGFADCCHTCAFYLERRCRAPVGFEFFPRVGWRLYREA